MIRDDKSRGLLPALYRPEPVANRPALFRMACTRIAGAAALGLFAIGIVAQVIR